MNYFSAKEKYINSASKPLVERINEMTEQVFNNSADSSIMGRGLLRCIQIEICYLMTRYKRWSSSECFSETSIDFFNSEYRIPRKISTEIVEGALDIVSESETIAHFKSPEEVDKDFLLNLFIETTIAKNDEGLEMSLGFGKNIISIIENATVGLDDQDSNFEYTSNIKSIMSGIIQEVIEKIQLKPWIIDLYP